MPEARKKAKKSSNHCVNQHLHSNMTLVVEYQNWVNKIRMDLPKWPGIKESFIFFEMEEWTGDKWLKSDFVDYFTWTNICQICMPPFQKT